MWKELIIKVGDIRTNNPYAHNDKTGGTKIDNLCALQRKMEGLL